jgi:hypothetical protein
MLSSASSLANLLISPIYFSPLCNIDELNCTSLSLPTMMMFNYINYKEVVTKNFFYKDYDNNNNK